MSDIADLKMAGRPSEVRAVIKDNACWKQKHLLTFQSDYKMSIKFIQVTVPLMDIAI